MECNKKHHIIYRDPTFSLNDLELTLREWGKIDIIVHLFCYKNNHLRIACFELFS